LKDITPTLAYDAFQTLYELYLVSPGLIDVFRLLVEEWIIIDIEADRAIQASHPWPYRVRKIPFQGLWGQYTRCTWIKGLDRGF
jgi:hypothetical protein